MDSTTKSAVRGSLFRSLGRHAFLVGLGSVSLAGLGGIIALSEGCGDSEEAPADQVGKRPPGPEGPPTPSSEERVYAMSSLNLGEIDKVTRNPSPDAWKSIGFNLDGRITNVTSASSPDLGRVCKRPNGAEANVHQDGDQGTDNVFGNKIVDLLSFVIGTPSPTISTAMANGNFTVLFKIKGLTDDPQQTNTGLSGTQLVGGSFSDAGAPTFTPADDWPVVPGAEGTLTNAYVNKGVFVNGGPDTLMLNFGISGQTLTLTVRNAIVTFKHNPSAGGHSLEEGTIAGVIDTEEFVSSVVGIAGRFSPQYCQGLGLEVIKTQIRNASDSLLDGTADPTRNCDALSVGIGFTAKQVGVPTRTAPPAESSTGVCGDAGANTPPPPPPPPVDAGADDAGDAGDADAN